MQYLSAYSLLFINLELSFCPMISGLNPIAFHAYTTATWFYMSIFLAIGMPVRTMCFLVIFGYYSFTSQYIFLGSDRFKMIRINVFSVPAKMINLESFWNGVHKVNIRIPVRSHPKFFSILVYASEIPISIIIYAPLPFPALFSIFWNAKSLQERLFYCFYFFWLWFSIFSVSFTCTFFTESFQSIFFIVCRSFVKEFIGSLEFFSAVRAFP